MDVLVLISKLFVVGAVFAFASWLWDYYQSNKNSNDQTQKITDLENKIDELNIALKNNKKVP